MPNTWDGRDRRRADDHDTLIELMGILNTHVENQKIVADNLKNHEMQDREDFDSIKKDILKLQQIVWTATGILIALDALPKLAEILHIVK